MYAKAPVIIIQSAQIVRKMNVFGVKTMNGALTKMRIHLHSPMVSVENGQQTSTVVELHQVIYKYSVTNYINFQTVHH